MTLLSGLKGSLYQMNDGRIHVCRPQYNHGPKLWTRESEDGVRWVVRTLARAFAGGYRSPRCGTQAVKAPRGRDPA